MYNVHVYVVFHESTREGEEGKPRSNTPHPNSTNMQMQNDLGAQPRELGW